MEAIKFVTVVRERVIEDDNQVYQELLENTLEAKDPIWGNILPIYKSLTKEQRLAFLQFLRLIQVNTLSHVFGILDGSTDLSDSDESFVLKTEQSEDVINGDLQDIFLEMEEI